MNSLVAVTFVAFVAVAQAGWYGPSAHILQGPSSKTTVVGPEGSAISAVAPGGQIFHEVHPGVVAHAAPIHHVPIVAHHAPVVAHPHVPHTVVAHHAPHDSVLIHGPSGSISTGHVPVVAHAAPVVAHVAAPYHAHEGQYVHDHSELLFDDGSYKPHLYHH